MKDIFERCPICQRVKKAAAVCMVCGTLIVAAATTHDPHTHDEKNVPESSGKVTLTVESSASDTGDLGVTFVVKGWPPKST